MVHQGRAILGLYRKSIDEPVRFDPNERTRTSVLGVYITLPWYSGIHEWAWGPFIYKKWNVDRNL